MLYLAVLPYSLLHYCLSGFLPLRHLPGRLHYGLRTRRGVPPPCTRDPTFHPCIFPLRPGLRCYPYCTRSGRNPLPDRRCRSRHPSLLRHQGLLRFVTSYLFWARRTCFPAVKRVRSRSMLYSTFLSSGTGFVNDGSYGLREFVKPRPSFHGLK